MTDRHIPTGFDHIGDVKGCFLGSLILIFNRLVFFIFNQRVTANCNHC